MSTEDAVVIDTPEGIKAFALLQAYHRLRLEIRSGLVFKTSTLAAIKSQFPEVTARTKAKALVQYEEVLKREIPGWTPKSS
jgi:hypothetical protein